MYFYNHKQNTTSTFEKISYTDWVCMGYVCSYSFCYISIIIYNFAVYRMSLLNIMVSSLHAHTHVYTYQEKLEREKKWMLFYTFLKYPTLDLSSYP